MSDAPAQTPLYRLHQQMGARMVPFAGYSMPLQYSGILAEHRHTREAASLFDVSHMGQIRLVGKAAATALEQLTPADLVGLPEGRQRYALLTDETGGILDDFMVSNNGDHLLLVVNAACKTRDLEHLLVSIGGTCVVEELTDRALLALQGPQAAQVLARLDAGLTALRFMDARRCRLAGVDCFVTRSGYTGEDGFEISVPRDQALDLAGQLLEQPETAPAGLGARDSLRLEAGLCLYGHDIDETTTPLEAGLGWAIGKARRPGGGREGGFPGAAVILPQLGQGVSRKRVGLLPEGRVPVREGAEILDTDGNRVGKVTSGGFGPSLNAPVAMGYVDTALSAPGTPLQARVRNKTIAMGVSGLPFVPPRYHRG